MAVRGYLSPNTIVRTPDCTVYAQRLADAMTPVIGTIDTSGRAVDIAIPGLALADIIKILTVPGLPPGVIYGDAFVPSPGIMRFTIQTTAGNRNLGALTMTLAIYYREATNPL